MALNFPSTPSANDVYTDGNGIVWEFDGVKWNVATGTAYKTYSGVKLKLSTSYNLTSTSTAVNFDTEAFDTDSYFSVTTPSRVTIAKSGYYRINASIFSSSSGSSYTISIKKNGSTELASTTIAPNQFSNFDEIIELVIGDYLQVYALDSTSTGALTDNSVLEVTRLGLPLGTSIPKAESFSGARAKLTSLYNTTSSSTAISWNTTDFNQNANAIGSLYWNGASPSRLTIYTTGYYRLSSDLAVGASEGVTLILKKNGSTNIDTVSIPPSGGARIDETILLNINDYIELYANDTTSNGSILADSYFEITRIGV